MGSLHTASTENVWFPVFDASPAGPYNPTGNAVAFAFTNGAYPATGDWKTGTWESGTVEIDGSAYYLARVLVGPGGLVTLPKGFYSIWLKIGTTNPLITKGSVLQVY